MRHVDRNAVLAPKILSSSAAASARDRVRAYFQKKGSAVRKQDRFDFESRIWLGAGSSLFNLFAEKCAYCESQLEPTSLQGEVEHFRPKSSVRDASGTRLDRGYWWLAYEWQNLYLTCRECSVYKSDAFPLEDESARALSPGDSLLHERPLLLDPCEDWPEEHLRFLDDGRVEGLTPRGATTIDILRLNRQSLIDSRRHLVRELKPLAHLDPVRRDPELLIPSTEYSQALWQCLARIAQANGMVDAWNDYLRRCGVPPHTVQVLFARDRDQPAVSTSVPRVLPTTAAPALSKRAVAVRIRRIELEHVRAVRKLTLDIPDDRAAPVVRPEDSLEDSLAGGQETLPWLLLLGENATGKSTVLEALALALIGQEGIAKLGLHPKRWLTKSKRVGRITIVLREGTEERTIRLRINGNGFHFDEGGEPLAHLVRGYGRARLPGDASKRLNIDVANLFSPREGLVNVDHFFSSLKGATDEDASTFGEGVPSTFDLYVRAVWDVLRGARLPERSEAEGAAPSETRYLHVSGADDRLYVKVDGEDFAFDELSAGYQSTVSLIADILSGMPDGAAIDPRELTGVVLLDEIGTDLHPRWRRRIVRDLREALPNIQFIASTHEPLCLQGLQKEDRIVLLRANERPKVFGDGAPSPAGMRADQLLTSRFFGLQSTIDEGLDQLFRHYYEKLARLVAIREAARSRRAPDPGPIVERIDAHEARIKELQQQLEDERRVLDSARDELLEARAQVDGGPSHELDTLAREVEELRSRIFQQTGATAERGNVVALRLGSTLREQRLLEIVDEEIARDFLPRRQQEEGTEEDPAAVKLLRAETKARVLALWKGRSKLKEGP